jgi:molybdenum cofactor cytidylyltransferase
MKFGPVPLEQAEGKILGHNVAGNDGRRALRKGKALEPQDIEVLRQLGRSTVYVAELEPGDVYEDTAALRLARAAMGHGLRLSGPTTGRANLVSQTRGVLRVDGPRLARFNSCQGVTLATLPHNTAVQEGKMMATMKILPYALPEDTVRRAEKVAAEGGPLLRLDALESRSVGLILSGSPSARERIVRSFETALRQRLEALGATIDRIDFVPLEDEPGEAELAKTIRDQVADELDLMMRAGETESRERYDMAPREEERVGGEGSCVGAAVDPELVALAQQFGGGEVVGRLLAGLRGGGLGVDIDGKTSTYRVVAVYDSEESASDAGLADQVSQLGDRLERQEGIESVDATQDGAVVVITVTGDTETLARQGQGAGTMFQVSASR